MDWKEALANLQGSGAIPQVDDTPDEGVLPVNNPPVKKKGKIHVVIEKKGRKGKTATIAEGFTCSDEELLELASRAKQKLGCGGSARGGEILIQGECRERLVEFLRSEGYSV